MARLPGPAAGLALADPLRNEPSLSDYPELPAVRATFLQQLGRADEARQEFHEAAARTTNADQRRPYLDQAARLDDEGRSPTP